MASAFKCDRCGKYEDDSPVAGVTFNLPTGERADGTVERKTDARELCSRCLASLRDWLETYRNAATQGVYR